jgi:hypothetical protein
MPFKDIVKRKAYHRRYDIQRYQRLRLGLVQALGGKCVVCGTTEDLEVHDIIPILSRSRTNAKSYFVPEGKELRCKTHHSHTEVWRGKRRRKVVL